MKKIVMVLLLAGSVLASAEDKELKSNDGGFSLFIPAEKFGKYVSAEGLAQDKALFDLMESQVEKRPVEVDFLGDTNFTGLVDFMNATYGVSIVQGFPGAFSYPDSTADNDFVIVFIPGYIAELKDFGLRLVVMTYERWLASR